MPQVDFSFQGWVRGAEIDTVDETATGRVIDVSEKTAEEVSAKLNSGEWCISLGEHLYNSNIRQSLPHDWEIEIFDFEESS